MQINTSNYILTGHFIRKNYTPPYSCNCLISQSCNSSAMQTCLSCFRQCLHQPSEWRKLTMICWFHSKHKILPPLAAAAASELSMWLASSAVGVFEIPSATTMDTRWPAVPAGSRAWVASEKNLSPVIEVILNSTPGDTSKASRSVLPAGNKQD